MWVDKIAKPKGKMTESFAIDSTIDMIDMMSGVGVWGQGVRIPRKMLNEHYMLSLMSPYQGDPEFPGLFV